MKKLLLTCMLALSVGVYAQVGPPTAVNPNANNGYGFSQTSGTYTPLSANRTVWQSGSALSTDGISSLVTIPSFKYNGKTYNSVYISNNGFVTFGATSSLASTTTGLSTDSSAPNTIEGAIAGFSANLVNANTTTSEIAYETVGSKFVVQFTDLKVSGGSSSQLLNFQIQLDSSNNSIAIVYGTCASGSATATGQVGLKGAEASDLNNRTGADWTSTAVGTSTTSTVTFGTTGGVTIPASGLTFNYSPGTWLAAPTTYATIPFTENFSNWVNGNSTADLPNATYWRTWPSRGDNSWRASDITDSGFTSASGWSGVGGSSTVSAPAVTPAARFHSYNCLYVSGYMDLYVNLSGNSGDRLLTFNYLNTSGTDILQVQLSTDGGNTFTNIGSSIGVQDTWATKDFVLPSVSSTAILRFLATGDNGGSDIYVDNVNISINTTPPACTTITAPLNNATGVALAPTISWTSSVGTTSYKINLGTTPGGTDILNSFDVGNVITYTIPSTTPLLYGKLYYVKVLPSNSYGTAIGCTEFSFTTKNLNCPSVSAPSSSATNVSLTPTFTWTAVTDATGYKLTIGTTPGGNNILNAFDLGNVTTYTLPTSLTIGTKYYYTLNAYNSYNSSLSCTERSFTTAGCATVSAPASAATGVSLTPTFTWAAVTGVTGYKLNIGTTSGGTDVLNAFDVGNVTTYTLPNSLALGTKYYYTLNSYNSTSTTPGCSERTFTTLTACPSVSAPASAATGVSVTPTFTWAASANATGYKITIGTTSGGNDVLNAFDVGNVLTYTLPTPLNNGLKYFYTINGYNATSTSLGCSERNFTTVVTCFVPTALAITPSSVTTSGATATWTAPSTVPSNGYEVYYSSSSTAPTFTTPLNATNSVTSLTTSAPISGLSPSTAYYVWVRSVCNGPDRSSWTSVATFVTLCQPPALLSTTGTTVCPGNTATLSATAESGATITWYDAATAGTVLGTGLTYTTPVLSTTTNYYASAKSNGVSGDVGPVNPSALSSISATSYDVTTYYQIFDVTVPTTLVSIDVFPTAAVGANSAIEIRNSAGVTLINIPYTVTVTGGNTAQTIVLNYPLSVGTGYRIGQGTGVAINLNRNTEGANYPYTSSAINVTGNNFSLGTNYWYYIYNWKFSSSCEGPRQMVTATVSSVGCLGTSEAVAKESIQVYPNPFTDVLNISDIKNVKSISVMDVAGRLVKSFEKPTANLQLSELSSGMYLVVLHMNDGTKQTVKAIKK
ncbi:Ig-like domain-containing protein [Chryseobacterium oryzae]|uniref:T9SS type A sorting domain-containing protein n=1 Tax=Chryseobacterium oryzae TaxID=2929799 RepID=A0ABY4BD97_9FLAO|nr:fibronectin type III domain-containing protein [Chryseobacterium oryzae]UOE37132.1 T9SS type A sorting domain-containing protein [Chryseobacterium oryzae]